jgi:ferric-dicitrate binding protein FerR (iron transport regulator)
MTPFRNDAQNPFGRERDWPPLPQTPLPVRRWRAAAPRRTAALDEALVVAAEPEAETPVVRLPPMAEAAPEPARLVPMAGPRPSGPQRRGLRLMPLVVSGALGACGLATLFVVIVLP